MMILPFFFLSFFSCVWKAGKCVRFLSPGPLPAPQRTGALPVNNGILREGVESQDTRQLSDHSDRCRSLSQVFLPILDGWAEDAPFLMVRHHLLTVPAGIVARTVHASAFCVGRKRKAADVRLLFRYAGSRRSYRLFAKIILGSLIHMKKSRNIWNALF